MAIQRTAQGRTIDMATLAAKNEKVRAVGNMNVNARGDVLDNHNNVIRDNTNRVKNVYRNTVTPGQQTQPPQQVAPKPTIEADETPEPIELTQEEAELFDDVDDEEVKK
jgi:hypothetical protein